MEQQNSDGIDMQIRSQRHKSVSDEIFEPRANDLFQTQLNVTSSAKHMVRNRTRNVAKKKYYFQKR